MNIQNLKILLTKIILNSAENINSVASEKYALSPNEIEKRSLKDPIKSLETYSHRIEKTRQVHKRLNRYDQNFCRYKRKKLKYRRKS